MSRRGLRGVISSISGRAHRAARNARDHAEEGIFDEVTYNDLTIQFIGANGIPKMDVVGSADPYFVADLDGHITIV